MENNESEKKLRINKHASDSLNAFGQITHYLDEHIQEIRVGVALIGLTGVLLIARSVRLMKKFCSASDIPEEFIRKQVTLRGKVKGHRSDHLIVEHLPIMQGWRLIGKKPEDSSLPIHLAGITLPGASMHHLVTITTPGTQVWFKLLTSTPNQGLDCIVYKRRKWLPSKQLNVHLVKQGLASVRPVEQLRGSNPASDRFVRSLVRAESNAKKRSRGIWAGPALSERLREKRAAVTVGVKSRASFLASPFVAAASTGRSVASKVGSFVGRFRWPWR